MRHVLLHNEHIESPVATYFTQWVNVDKYCSLSWFIHYIQRTVIRRVPQFASGPDGTGIYVNNTQYNNNLGANTRFIPLDSIKLPNYDRVGQFCSTLMIGSFRWKLTFSAGTAIADVATFGALRR